MFAVHGFFRGLIIQAAGAIGVLLGIWAGAAISLWVGARWAGAQPAVAFFVLKWIVVVLAGLAVASVFHGLGVVAAATLRAVHLGWLDRGTGVATGAVIGLAMACLLLLVLLSVPGPRWLSRPAAEARLARPVLHTGVVACAVAHRFPGARMLRSRLQAAERRLVGSASSI